MSDAFYNLVRWLGIPAFFVSASPVVIGAPRTRRSGAFIVAANHQSPYDVALLIRHSARHLDFLSIVEVFRNPFVGWFYGNMNAFALDRSRPDAPTVRTALDRLKQGRVVGMFPEGGFRVGEQSVIHSRRIRPGIGRLAKLAGAPIVPAVIVGSEAYWKLRSWMPIRRTRYGIIFGEAIEPTSEAAQIEQEFVERLIGLHATLTAAMAK